MRTGVKWLGGALAISLLATVGCQKDSAAQSRPAAVAVPVKVSPVEEGSISSNLSFSGSVQAKDTVELVAVSSGRLEKVLVEVGQYVKTGAPIAQQETDLLRANVRSSEASLQSAQAAYSTAQQGARPEEIASSRAALDAQRARHQGLSSGRAETIASAEAVLASAKARLADLQGGGRTTAQAAVETAQASVDTAQASVVTAHASVETGQAGIETAQSNVAAAEARLNQLQNPTPAAVQAGQSALEQARSAVATAESRRTALLSPTESQIRTVEASVAAAGKGVTDAEIRLSDLQNPTPDKIAIAESALAAAIKTRSALMNPAETDVSAKEAAVASAQAAVASAEAALADLKAQPKPADLQRDQTTLDQAKSSLEQAKAKREQAMTGLNQEKVKNLLDAYVRYRNAKNTLEDRIKAGDTEARIDAARTELQQALLNVQKAEEELNWVKPGVSAQDLVLLDSAVDSATTALKAAQARYEQTKAGPTEAQLRAAENIVEIAKSSLAGAQNLLSGVKNPQTADKAAAEAAVNSAQAQLDRLRNPTPSDLQSARSALDAARSTLASAQSSLATLKNPSETDRQAAQATVDSAKASVASAEASLNQLKNPTPSDIQAARTALDVARGQVATAQGSVAMARGSITSAQGAVATARGAVVNAQANLQRVTEGNGASGSDLQAARSAVQQAEQALSMARTPASETDLKVQLAAVQQAEQALSLTQNKTTNQDLQRAAAAVAVAEAQLELVKLQLSKATLAAPFDAVVAKKYLSDGALASAAQPVASLVAADNELVFNVEEAGLGRIKEGQSVALTVPAYGDKVFKARITTVSPVADASSRTFAVKAIPEDKDRELKAGMFANLQVTVASKTKALLIPRAAVVQRQDGPVIFVVKDEKAEMKKVKLGLQSETHAEVTEGVVKDDQVVVQGNRTLRGNDLVKVIP